MRHRTGGWRREVVLGAGLVRSPALAELAGIAHAFSTRDGTLGLGAPGASDEEAARLRRAFAAAAGIAAAVPVVVRQVHGATLARAAAATRSPRVLEADGVLALDSDGPDAAAAAVRTADCVPLLLAHRGGHAVAAVHAGWRGTAAGIARRAVESLGRLGFAPGDLVAAIGPAIGPCCYEVGGEVLDAVAAATGVPAQHLAPRHRHLDLGLANRLQLEAAGLRPAAIDLAPWCTACEAELFFSYRRDRGRTGSQLACIGFSAARGALGPA